MDNTKKEEISLSDLPIPQMTFIAAYIKCRGNVSKACKEVEMPRSTFYLWKKNDAEFLNALEEAKETLEETLFEQVYEFGFEGDITAAIFSLKALNREKYDDAFARQKYLLSQGAKVDGQGNIAPAPQIVLVRADDPVKTHSEQSH
jgi:hypothetical protein